MDAPADQQLRAFLHAGFDLVSSRLTEVSVLVNERQVLDPERRGRLLPMRMRIDGELRAILEAGEREGLWDGVPIESTRMAIWSLINYAVWWFQTDGSRTAREVADDFADIVLKGIMRNGRPIRD